MANDSLILNDDQIVLDDNKKYLDELVGESKKFKDVEALAKGKFYADQQVELLEKRMDELRSDYVRQSEEIAKGKKLDDLIQQLSTSQPRALPPAETETPSIKTEDIEAIAQRKYDEIESAKVQRENYNSVIAKLKERYGNNYTVHYKQQIEALGLTDKYATDLAKTHPQVLIKTLGLDEAPVTDTFQAPPRSNQRTDRFAPTGAKEETWSYWQELKKNDPKAYFDPKTAIRMHDAAIRLGEKFKDGDFHRYGN